MGLIGLNDLGGVVGTIIVHHQDFPTESLAVISLWRLPRIRRDARSVLASELQSI
jgi:hypothetical protein